MPEDERVEENVNQCSEAILYRRYKRPPWIDPSYFDDNPEAAAYDRLVKALNANERHIAETTCRAMECAINDDPDGKKEAEEHGARLQLLRRELIKKKWDNHPGEAAWEIAHLSPPERDRRRAWPPPKEEYDLLTCGAGSNSFDEYNRGFVVGLLEALREPMRNYRYLTHELNFPGLRNPKLETNSIAHLPLKQTPAFRYGRRIGLISGRDEETRLFWSQEFGAGDHRARIRREGFIRHMIIFPQRPEE